MVVPTGRPPPAALTNNLPGRGESVRQAQYLEPAVIVRSQLSFDESTPALADRKNTCDVIQVPARKLRPQKVKSSLASR